jgi:hypothetical protein
MLAFAALLLLTTQNIAVPGRPDRLLAADLNGDGRAEIIAGCQQSVVVLLNDGKGRFRLASRAAAFGHATDIELLLAAGADREARDMHGDTPLGWASWYRRPGEILEPLCYGRFRISKSYRTDHGGLSAFLLGKPHLPQQ